MLTSSDCLTITWVAGVDSATMSKLTEDLVPHILMARRNVDTSNGAGVYPISSATATRAALPLQKSAG